MTVVLSSFRARQHTQERELAVEALRVCDGCYTAAARLCGLHPFAFRRMIVRHSLQSYLKRATRTRPGNAAWQELGE